ncbi:MAG: heme ABC exporter ATP-binding protein CcmA [Thermoflexales bacterium]|nr:heme ABC exporter ATP-binding protein CcmA [Thermoflexales bacterium]
MIHVHKLVKSFGPSAALRGVTLSVAEGEFVTVAGPNGAGKTTLLRVLATLSRPSAGQVRIGPYQLPGQAAEVRGQIGFLSHQPLLYGDLSAEENLRFYGRVYAVAELEARIDEVLELVGLEGRRRELVRTFSRGMQQRLAIARAVLHKPRLMLLDEPYTGLDQDAAVRLERVMSSVGTEGCTVLMTTHDLARGLAVADRVIILAKGRIAFEARRSEIDVEIFQAAYRRHTA